jgi:glycosyltransferase involved in cell wall biosynthesis
MLQELTSQFHPTLLCWRKPNLEKVNNTFRTSLRPDDFDVITVPGPLANSNYVKQLTDPLRQQHSSVLYPPAYTTQRDVVWGQRENAVLCIGRTAPSKRLEDNIEIVRRLRERGHKLTLHIAGNNDDDAYFSRISKRAQKLDWVQLHLNLDRHALDQLMHSCRYGVYGMRSEHFGMAVAEMQHAGCLVFVPQLGGCAEVVANPALTFANIFEAVTKFDAALTSVAQRTIHLHQQAPLRARFTPKQFCSEFLGHVNEFLCEENAIPATDNQP